MDGADVRPALTDWFQPAKPRKFTQGSVGVFRACIRKKIICYKPDFSSPGALSRLAAMTLPSGEHAKEMGLSSSRRGSEVPRHIQKAC